MTFRIADSILGTSIYLYPDEQSARAGKRVGGCGFLLGWSVQSVGGFTLWAVTNRHVIESGAWTIRVNMQSGEMDYIDTNETEWIFHETADLAIRPLALSQDVHAFNFLSEDWLLSREWFETLDIGPGDPCFTVGRFVGRDGRQRNTPTARFGQIAQLNTDPIAAAGVRPQDSFLVECRSIGGYSGAPVFLWLDKEFYRPKLNLKTAPDGTVLGQGAYPTGPWLLGVNWCMIPDWQTVCDSSGTELVSGYQVPANTGLMGVIPAWHLDDMFRSGPASDKHRQIEAAVIARAQAKGPGGITTGAEA